LPNPSDYWTALVKGTSEFRLISFESDDKRPTQQTSRAPTGNFCFDFVA
jgi:hypothetical protein